MQRAYGLKANGSGAGVLFLRMGEEGRGGGWEEERGGERRREERMYVGGYMFIYTWGLLCRNHRIMVKVLGDHDGITETFIGDRHMTPRLLYPRRRVVRREWRVREVEVKSDG